MPLRLIDLRCNWLWQYAAETTLYDSPPPDELERRVARLDGYMSGTAAAVLVCGRSAEDWGRRPDRWRVLEELLARTNPSFPVVS